MFHVLIPRLKPKGPQKANNNNMLLLAVRSNTRDQVRDLDFKCYYSCGLSTVTIEYSCPSVCLCVCVCLCLCVCACVHDN